MARSAGTEPRVDSASVGGPDSLTELIFFMVVLKIPILWVAAVVYRAIKAEPEREQGEPARVVVVRRGPRRPPPRPHGGPARAYARTARSPYARTDRLGPR